MLALQCILLLLRRHHHHANMPFPLCNCTLSTIYHHRIIRTIILLLRKCTRITTCLLNGSNPPMQLKDRLYCPLHPRIAKERNVGTRIYTRSF